MKIGKFKKKNWVVRMWEKLKNFLNNYFKVRNRFINSLEVLIDRFIKNIKNTSNPFSLIRENIIRKRNERMRKKREEIIKRWEKEGVLYNSYMNPEESNKSTKLEDIKEHLKDGINAVAGLTIDSANNLGETIVDGANTIKSSVDSNVNFLSKFIKMKIANLFCKKTDQKEDDQIAYLKECEMITREQRGKREKKDKEEERLKKEEAKKEKAKKIEEDKKKELEEQNKVRDKLKKINEEEEANKRCREEFEKRTGDILLEKIARERAKEEDRVIELGKLKELRLSLHRKKDALVNNREQFKDVHNLMEKILLLTNEINNVNQSLKEIEKKRNEYKCFMSNYEWVNPSSVLDMSISLDSYNECIAQYL